MSDIRYVYFKNFNNAFPSIALLTFSVKVSLVICFSKASSMHFEATSTNVPSRVAEGTADVALTESSFLLFSKKTLLEMEIKEG